MKLLTLARDLRRRTARERHELFVAEGVRAVEELVRSPLAVRGVLADSRASGTPRGAALLADLARRGVPVESVSERDLASASDTETPQGILAIGEVPRRRLEDLAVGERSRLLVLDGVQDPGNAGTMLRTAAAFGAAATLAVPGTVDLWNAKVVRSSMGALFHHQAFATTWSALDDYLRSTTTILWGSDASGQPIELAEPAPPHLAIAAGNEGSGHSDEARRRCQRMVAIPLAAGVESLNAAVATGILLYRFRL